MNQIKRAAVQSVKTIPRALVVVAEVSVVLAVIMALAVTVFLGRLARTPLDLSFAKTVIAESLSGHGQSLQMDFDRAVLSWPDPSLPFHLNLQGVRLTENGQMLGTIDTVDVLVARGPLLLGLIRPVRLVVDAPVLAFTRDVDNNLRLSLVDQQNALAEKGPQNNGMNAVVDRLFTGKGRGILSDIQEIEVRNARVRIVDHVMGMTWGVNRANLQFRKVDEGILGNIGIELTNKQQFTLLVTYQRARDVIEIKSKLDQFPILGMVGRVLGVDDLRRQKLALTGEVTVRGKLNPFRLDQLSIKADANTGTFDMDLEQERIILPVSAVRLNMAYDREKTGWDVSTFDLRVADVPVSAGATLTRDSSGVYQGMLELRVPNVKQDQILPFWPKGGRDHGLGKWMTEKLSGIAFSDVHVDIPVQVGVKDGQFNFEVLSPRARWAFDNLRADYLPPLVPVEQGKGTATYENDTLAIQISEGRIRDLTLKKDSTVTMTELTKAGAGEAHLDVTLMGPLKTMTDYIRDEPIAMGHKIPFDTRTVSGTGAYHAVVSFPTLKDLPKDQVKAEVEATVDQVSLPNVVKGQTVSGGPFQLVGSDGLITLSGQGQIKGRALKLDWREPVTQVAGGPCTEGTIWVDTDSPLRQALAGGLSFVDGSMPVNMVYKDCGKGVETLNISGDLTPTRLNLRALGYEKPSGKSGKISMDVTVRQNPSAIEARHVTITAPDVKMREGALDFAKAKDGTVNLVKATLVDYKFGNSTGALIYQRHSDRIALDVAGTAFDLGPFLSGDADQPLGIPMSVKMKVDRLGFGGNSVLENANLNVNLDRGSDLDRMDITGRAGAGNVMVKYMPDASGRMNLNVNAEDAGAFLRVFDIYENAQGGTLTLNAVPIGDNNRDVKGTLIMRDFAVVKAPVLAQLLGAMSIKGLGEQLTNQGIGFDRLESGFALVRRSGKDIMSFREGRTKGSSLGITFDGIYDRRNGTVDIGGTIIPASGVNTLTSRIPLIGRLLTGGEGNALFAVTYSVKGPSENPKTSINPLAVLTPGILRKIFFEDSPDDPTDTPKGRLNE